MLWAHKDAALAMALPRGNFQQAEAYLDNLIFLTIRRRTLPAGRFYIDD
ncbi:hypothetical protein KDA_69860 [Dictyobacter alpinus]|uniref:Uncharacterized protein n=1 Tax=Dictyobacter alpinus TaxID=2014873 RepID=A0A402BJH8_9CHLR|nr:hypothetical protein KDA_69860 [Dictyobacter alpinus]